MEAEHCNHARALHCHYLTCNYMPLHLLHAWHHLVWVNFSMQTAPTSLFMFCQVVPEPDDEESEEEDDAGADGWAEDGDADELDGEGTILACIVHLRSSFIRCWYGCRPGQVYGVHTHIYSRVSSAARLILGKLIGVWALSNGLIDVLAVRHSRKGKFFITCMQYLGKVSHADRQDFWFSCPRWALYSSNIASLELHSLSQNQHVHQTRKVLHVGFYSGISCWLSAVTLYTHLTRNPGIKLWPTLSVCSC